MTPTEIAARARILKDAADLLSLINDIRLSEDGNGRKPIGKSSFVNYCNPNSKSVRYTVFDIPKKTGGVRTISAPVSKLKAILWPVNELLKSLYEPKPCVMGFTNGRSIADNAKAHLGQNYILNLDLKDFFPSIHKSRVWKRLQLPPFNFTDEVAHVIAGLCSIKIVDADGENQYVLPQGAPTSPILTNIVCEKMDHRLSGVASRFNLRYTRYADDMTFSSMHNVLAIDGEAFAEIRRIVEDQNFTINEKKTRLQKRGGRQEVTGLILSNKINVTRQYIRDLDQFLYVWEHFGYEMAFARMVKERSHSANNSSLPSLECVIGGKLNYLKMVKGETDKVYVKYNTIFERCMKTMASQQFEGDEWVYLASYRYDDFARLFPDSIRFEGEGRDVKAFLSIDKAHYPLHLSIKVRHLLPTNAAKGISPRNTKKLYISLCSSGKSTRWMIHWVLPMKEETMKLSLPVSEIVAIWKEKGLEAAMEADKDARLDKIAESMAKDMKRKKNTKVMSDIRSIPYEVAVANVDLNDGSGEEVELEPEE